MSTNVQLLNVSPEELAELISTNVKEELLHKIPNKPISDFITTKKALEILGVTEPSRWRYVRRGILNKYNFEGKTFYKLSEIEANMLTQKR